MQEVQEIKSDVGELLVSLVYNENLSRLTATIIEARRLKVRLIYIARYTECTTETAMLLFNLTIEYKVVLVWHSLLYNILLLILPISLPINYNELFVVFIKYDFAGLHCT